MAQDRDQYLQFTIKLLKGSFALSALWQDALNYHMIDQPEKLIAMRLTEYYELMARGVLRPGPSMTATDPTAPSVAGSSPVAGGAGEKRATPAPQASSSPSHATPVPRTPTPLPAANANGNLNARPVPPAVKEEIRPGTGGDIVTRSSSLVVEQNADDAADYWSPL